MCSLAASVGVCQPAGSAFYCQQFYGLKGSTNLWDMGNYLESRSRGIFYMKNVNGRRTGLVTFCIETAFYNGLLKERYKGK
jgi:hypothetical protein